jgi:hypothetical protein
MVLAFSLQSDVKSIGAYAGFAAIIGLALLVLLYFAQAREIRRLSDWLEQQEDRLRNLPARAAVPRPVPTAPAARVAAAPAVAADRDRRGTGRAAGCGAARRRRGAGGRRRPGRRRGGRRRRRRCSRGCPGARFGCRQGGEREQR